MFAAVVLQGRQAPDKPAQKERGDPDRPRPAEKGKGRQRPAARQKPAARKPAVHKPAQRPQTKKPQGKKTAGRGDLDAEPFDDIEFAPLATSGHIH